MRFNELFYPESRFGGFTDIDGTMAFFLRVNSLLSPSHTVLDVGCGRGAHAEDPVRLRRDLRTLRGKVQKVIGIDVDAAAAGNPCVDEFRLIEGDRWPLADTSVDLIVCDHVLEHLDRPEGFFSELSRVLRSSGYICIRTPNAWGYIALFSRLIPNRRHAAILSVVQRDRKEEDVFPTLYRCNTISRIRTGLRMCGCTEEIVYGYEAEPTYLSFSPLAYWLGVLHQKLTPGIFKTTLFAFGRKTGPSVV